MRGAISFAEPENGETHYKGRDAIMKIAIYQIDVELDSARVAFQDLNRITSAYNGRIPTELYDCVFSGEVAAKTLEDVFYIFNMARPKGYKGRSLSVSDVVAIYHSAEEKTYYYCEPLGFKQITFDVS